MRDCNVNGWWLKTIDLLQKVQSALLTIGKVTAQVQRGHTPTTGGWPWQTEPSNKLGFVPDRGSAQWDYHVRVLPFTNDSDVKTPFQGSTRTLTLSPEDIHPFWWGTAGSASLTWELPRLRRCPKPSASPEVPCVPQCSIRQCKTIPPDPEHTLTHCNLCFAGFPTPSGSRLGPSLWPMDIKTATFKSHSRIQAWWYLSTLILSFFIFSSTIS